MKKSLHLIGNVRNIVLLTIAMANEVDALFEELYRYLTVSDTTQSREIVIERWRRYNEWMAENERVSLEDYLRRIIQV